MSADTIQRSSLSKDSIQLLAVTSAVRVFIVQRARRPIVRINPMERVAGEVFVAHDLPVGEFVERVVHSLNVALERSFRRRPATFEQVLAVIRVDGGCSREFTPLRLPRNRRFILVETDVVIGGGMWVRPD
jgi:non-ribosomal peptide synthetase component F